MGDAEEVGGPSAAAGRQILGHGGREEAAQYAEGARRASGRSRSRVVKAPADGHECNRTAAETRVVEGNVVFLVDVGHIYNQRLVAAVGLTAGKQHGLHQERIQRGIARGPSCARRRGSSSSLGARTEPPLWPHVPTQMGHRGPASSAGG